MSCSPSRQLLAVFVTLLLLLIDNNFVFAADCTTHTSPVTIDGSACDNYIFSGSFQDLQIEGAAGSSTQGIYFDQTFSCTGCIISLTGVSVTNAIIAAPMSSFSGGSISIDNVRTQRIVFYHMTLTGQASITIRGCHVHFDSTNPPPDPPVNNGVLPWFGLAVYSPSAALTLSSITIESNTVNVTTYSETYPLNYGLALRGQDITQVTDTGDNIGATVLVKGNTVTCVGCIHGGLRATVTARTPTADSTPYAIKTSFITSDNAVNVIPKVSDGGGYEFAACWVTSAGFTSPIFSVLNNTCVAVADSTVLPPSQVENSYFFKIYGLRIAVPQTPPFTEFFNFKFIRASECGAININQNKAHVAVGRPVFGAAEGLSVLGFLAPQIQLQDNYVNCSGAQDSRGLVLDPRAVDAKSKFHSPWVVDFSNTACITQFGSCPMPSCKPIIQRNIVHVKGGEGEILGFLFPPLGIRLNPGVSGVLDPIPVPFIFPIEMNDNTFHVKSSGSFNYTVGIRIGDPLIPNMAGTYETKVFNNNVHLECDGAAATTGQTRHCAGSTNFVGIDDADIPPELKQKILGFITINYDYLKQAIASVGGTFSVTCSGHYDSCTGVKISVATALTTYTLSSPKIDVTLTEIGDAPSTQDHTHGHNGFLFVRNPGAIEDVSLTATITDLRVFHSQNRISTPSFGRVLFRIDSAGRVIPAKVTISKATTDLSRRFTLDSTPQQSIPTFFSHPFPSGASGSQLIINDLYASHQDYCQDGPAVYEINSTVPVYRYKECWGWEKGEYARPLTLNPAGNSVPSGHIQIKKHTFRGMMQRRCPKFFYPDMRTSCGSSCSLQIGCEGCSNFWTGLENAADSWQRTYGSDECPTARTGTKTRTVTRTRTRSKDPPTPTKIPLNLPPTLTDELTLSDTITHELTATKTHILTHSDTLPPTRTKSVSLSIPQCFPGLRLEAQVTTINAGTTRAVERENVRVLIRLEPPQMDIALSSMWDVIAVGNVTKQEVSIIDVDGAKPLELVSVSLIGVRTIEAIVRAQTGTNAFRDNVAGRFKVDPKILKCRFNASEEVFETLAATEFERRFVFLPAPATSAIVGVGVTALYLQTLLMGSSGISFWYAGRRSIGIYDAVACKTKKDSLITIIDSPLQLELGDGYLGLARGTVIGNGAIAFFFLAVVLGFAIYRSTSTWKPLFSPESMSWAGAPNFFIPVCCMLIPGSMQATVQLMANADGVDIGLAIFFGLGFVIATPLVVAKALLPPQTFWTFVKTEDFMEKVPNPNYDKDFARQQKKLIMLQQQNLENGIEDEEMNEMMLLSGMELDGTTKKGKKKGGAGGLLGATTKQTIKQKPKSLLKRWFGPSIVYKTIRQHFVNRYGVMFDRNMPTLYWITIADVVVAILGGIAAGLPFDRELASMNCRTAIVAHIAIIIIGMFFMGLTPFCCPFDNAIILIVYVIGLANAVISVLADMNDDEALGAGSDVIAFILMILFIAKIVIDGLRLWKVHWTWQARRLYYLITRKTPPNIKRRGGGGLDGDDDDDDPNGDSEEAEMRRREEEEEREIQMIERKKQLQRRTLPPPVPVEPEDLRSERRRRQQQVEPLLDELAATRFDPPPNILLGSTTSSLHASPSVGRNNNNNSNSAYVSPMLMTTSSPSPTTTMTAKSPSSHLEQKIQEETKKQEAARLKKLRKLQQQQQQQSPSNDLQQQQVPPDLATSATAPDFGQFGPSFSSANFGPSLNVGLPQPLAAAGEEDANKYFEQNDKNEDRNKNLHTREFIAEQQRQQQMQQSQQQKPSTMLLPNNLTPVSSPQQQMSPQAIAKKKGEIPSSLMQFVRSKEDNKRKFNDDDDDDDIDEYFSSPSPTAAAKNQQRRASVGAVSSSSRKKSSPTTKNNNSTKNNNNTSTSHSIANIPPKELLKKAALKKKLLDNDDDDEADFHRNNNNNNNNNSSNFDDGSSSTYQDDEEWLIKRQERKRREKQRLYELQQQQKLTPRGNRARSAMTQEEKMRLL